ncbi:MAG TPA: DUF692 domain-containing protein [Methylomirabilota bacterium]|nr:DUF692 domain-containing protein [Methylomirabilota bacterium]
MISSGGAVSPGLVGIGLRAPHAAEIIATPPPVGWLEVHVENYLGGGPAPRVLDAIRRAHPLSLHGVGLSLGSAEGLDRRHLERLAGLVRRIEPALVSEHLSWSITGGAYLNHLLPLPYTEESLALVCRHVSQAQGALGRRLLIENPSSYLRFRHSPIPEPEFLGELARRTGCGLLCDVNNVFVTCHNLGQDPAAYLAALPSDAIGEIHLAGHSSNDVDGRIVLIDDHGSRVAPAVWALYEQAVRRIGPRPTLIEWDTDIPELPVLLEEAARAGRILEQRAPAGAPHDVAA